MKEGDFVEIEYTGRISNSDEIFDLTSEKLAKEQGIFNPKAKYGPAKIIVGEGMLLKPLDEELKKIKINEEKKIDIPKKDGFGERDAKLVKLMSLGTLQKNKITPIPGQYIKLGAIQGKVLSVNSGRVKLDFNHPLAGKDLVYKVKILRKIENTKEMVEAVCEKVIKIKPDIEIKEAEATILTKIALPKDYKNMLKEEITKYVKAIKQVSVIEAK